MDQTTTDAAQEPDDKLPARKQLNLASLNKDVQAQNEAMQERLDSLEQSLGDIETNVSTSMTEMMALLKGMTAQDRPTEMPQYLESEDEFIGSEGAIEFTAHNQPKLILPTDGELEDPIKLAKYERMKFDLEPVEILISPPHEEHPDLWVEIGVNGERFCMLRGRRYIVPRFVVYGLAMAKPWTFDNKEYTDSAGVRRVKYPERVSVRYPFSVIRDANPRGARWLQSVLSQRNAPHNAPH